MTTTMRRFIVIFAALLAGVSAADAQSVNGVTVESYTMQRDGSFVIVDMDIDIRELEVKGSEAVVLTPHIVGEDNSVALKSVAIYGRNRDFYYQRNSDIAPTTNEDMVYRNTKCPEVVSYRAMVTFESWMDGSQLIFERADYGCNNSTVCKEGSVLVDRFPLEPYKPTFIYIRPEGELVKSREVSGAAYVDFPVSKVDIRPAYRNNTAELAKITGSIDMVKADADATITAITIKGYASPESPYDNNSRLARERTEALKLYVEGLYNFDSNLITTSYEPEDWAGLEAYVAASTLANKSAILAIIHSDDDPDRKEWLLKTNYPEDYAYLLKNCYPALRRSEYTIYYSLPKYSEPCEIEYMMNTEPQKLSLEEFYILAETYEVGSDQLDELWEVAVRMFPEDEIANFNAANSAMDKGDLERAARYLDKAGERPEVEYSRGCIKILGGDNEAALQHLERAQSRGVAEAAEAIEAVSNHWKVTRNKR